MIFSPRHALARVLVLGRTAPGNNYGSLGAGGSMYKVWGRAASTPELEDKRSSKPVLDFCEPPLHQFRCSSRANKPKLSFRRRQKRSARCPPCADLICHSIMHSLLHSYLYVLARLPYRVGIYVRLETVEGEFAGCVSFLQVFYLSYLCFLPSSLQINCRYPTLYRLAIVTFHAIAVALLRHCQNLTRRSLSIYKSRSTLSYSQPYSTTD